MDRIEDYYVKWNNKDSQRQVSHVFFVESRLKRKEEGDKQEGGRVQEKVNMIKVHYMHVSKCNHEIHYFV
jgi:hypothetical protein